MFLVIIGSGLIVLVAMFLTLSLLPKILEPVLPSGLVSQTGFQYCYPAD
jgi:hypothetical protein